MARGKGEYNGVADAEQAVAYLRASYEHNDAMTGAQNLQLKKAKAMIKEVYDACPQTIENVTRQLASNGGREPKQTEDMLYSARRVGEMSEDPEMSAKELDNVLGAMHWTGMVQKAPLHTCKKCHRRLSRIALHSTDSVAGERPTLIWKERCVKCRYLLDAEGVHPNGLKVEPENAEKIGDGWLLTERGQAQADRIQQTLRQKEVDRAKEYLATGSTDNVDMLKKGARALLIESLEDPDDQKTYDFGAPYRTWSGCLAKGIITQEQFDAICKSYPGSSLHYAGD